MRHSCSPVGALKNKNNIRDLTLKLHFKQLLVVLGVFFCRLYHLLQYRCKRRGPRLGYRTSGGQSSDSPDPGANAGHHLLLQDSGPKLKRHGPHV